MRRQALIAILTGALFLTLAIPGAAVAQPASDHDYDGDGVRDEADKVNRPNEALAPVQGDDFIRAWSQPYGTVEVIAPSGLSLTIQPLAPGPFKVQLDGTVLKGDVVALGPPLVGEPADGTWTIKQGNNFAGVPTGTTLQVADKTLEMPAFENGNVRVTGTTLWNWHESPDTHQVTGFASMLSPAEDPTLARYYSPV